MRGSVGEGDEAVTKVHAVDMELYKLYNVRKNCWHSHTLSEDARVLIVENRDTVEANSPFVGISESQCNGIDEEILEIRRFLPFGTGYPYLKPATKARVINKSNPE